MVKPIPPLEIARYPVVASDPATGATRLTGSRCLDCGALTFPSSGACSHCGGDHTAPQALSPTGTLYSFSVLHVGARGWPAPYVLGYVDLPEGVRVFAHIDAAPDQITLDMPVTVASREPIVNPEGNDVLAFVFKPALETAHA